MWYWKCGIFYFSFYLLTSLIVGTLNYLFCSYFHLHKFHGILFLCQWIPFYSRTLHCWLSKWFTLTSVTIRFVLQITPIQIWAGKLWKRTFKQWWSTIQSIWRKRITFHLLRNNILWKIKIDIPGKHSSMHMQFTYLKWVGDYYLMPSEQLISHIIARSYKWLCEEMMRLSALY